MSAGADLVADDGLLRTLYDADLPLAIAGADGRLRVANPALQQLLGYGEDEILAHHFSDFAHPDDVASDEALFAELLAGTRSQYQIEKRYLRRDGRVLYGRLTVTLQRRGPGSELLMIGLLQDLTEARVAAATNARLVDELGERTKELNALHACARLLIAEHATDGDLLRLVAGLVPPGLQFPDHATACVRYRGVDHATPGHRSSPATLRVDFTTSDRTAGTIEAAYHGPAVGAAFIVEELRLLELMSDMVRVALDRRLAQRGVREASERLDVALDAARMGVWEWDLDTDHVTWSPHMERLVGYDAAIDGPLDDKSPYMHPDDGPALAAWRNEMVDPEQLYTIEFRMRRPDGSWRPVCGTGRFLPGPEGKRGRVVGVTMDITARRILEMGLQQAQKLEALGHVAGSVAHDFNNLLMVITGNTQALMEDLAGTPHRELLDEIDSAASQGAALTSQLLAFSRRREFRPSAVALDQLIERMRPLLVRLVGPDIEVRTVLAASAGRVWADVSQLEQVVLNLVVNARDAMPDGGTLTITTALVDAARAVVSVSDTGTGIDPEVAAHMFEPFFTTKPPGQGTGLGLAVVRAVARQWRGEVTVDSTPGAGATFRVRLPLVA